ncbi:MAG: sigma-54-dependent Fis family transcriptional regulator [Deltaproteobacteria bacterium]|nr:sigma-54-dependent Fis family transcriptional regulator [Deltaproteobacteria bacterium]
MTEPTVLIVDDERSNRESLEKIFQKEGFRTLGSEGGPAALELCRKHSVDVIVTDLMMPGMSGVDLLRAVKTISPEIEVVLMTAYGTVETAVDAMRGGAYDFVEKPLKRMQIVKTVRKALEKRSLVVENRSLRQQIRLLEHRSIVGTSAAWRRTMEVALQAAPSSATVLVMGESGTGKELVARAIHDASGRAAGPFVAVNCAAIPETIIEAELFGHERGAFTGATARRDGRFAQAAGGTLFFDEVGDIPLALQVKLLRALQEGTFEPLGGRTQRTDVRIVAATNRGLAAEIKAGRFREDLYYRLNVIALTCPPLRERREDIPLLADHFLRVYCEKNGGKVVSGFTRAAMDALCETSWPGNVRQLENAVERAVVLTKQSQIAVEDLPREITEEDRPSADLVIAVGTPLEEIERRAIHETLRHTRGDKKLAAQLLGIATRTIYRKLAEETGVQIPADLEDEAEEGR